MRNKNLWIKISSFLIALAIVVGIIVLGGWGNKTLFDTTYTFNRAEILMPDGDVISRAVESWTDFEDGDQIQVKIDGKTYLVHSSNIVMIAE